MGKLETIIALSSIIGLAALLLQNKKAIGDFGGGIKEKLTFTSPIAPSPEKTVEENTISEPTEAPAVISGFEIPSSMVSVKRFEQPQIISTPTPIVPPPTVNRGTEIVKPQSGTSIQGSVRSEIKTDQRFKVFSSDKSKTPKAVIRRTRQDPKELQVDTLKRPTETASQRANRVFTSTGKFADEDRGATKASSRRKFNFGTNTGRGGRRPTTTKGGERQSSTTKRSAGLSRSDSLKREAEKAKKVFDSRSISNF